MSFSLLFYLNSCNAAVWRATTNGKTTTFPYQIPAVKCQTAIPRILPTSTQWLVWFTYSTVVLYIQMTLIILFQLPRKLFISLGMLHNGRNVYQLLGETHRSCVFGSGRISHSRSWIDLHVGQLHKQMEI